MTPAEFKRKWHRYRGKESAAYQEHFNDLCRLLGQPTPVEADPSGNDFFCFQKGVIKEAGLLPLDEQTGEPKKGFADVWKKDCFGWEYKGKHKNLEKAQDQLKLYRESLLNPPLLAVCDFDRYIIRTNFNGTVQETHEFTNDQVDRPEILRILRALFEDPGFLKPQRTTAQVTENLAAQIAEVTRSLQSRESVELADARTRAEVQVAQKKNLRIARFLNRIIFCFFAEDTSLLPKKIFSDICKAGLDDPKLFAESLEQLFRVMARGGVFGHHKIRHFNGHLFEDSTVFELTEVEIRKLADASEANWQFIQPSIMGTLFERALDEGQRTQLGAHYTSETDIKTLVEPVLMQPLRHEWTEIKSGIAGVGVTKLKSRGQKSETPHVVSYKARLETFQKKLATITVLDPACGSGNFLYVSLQLLLGLEKEVVTFAMQLGISLKLLVSVQQLKAIEINPYAFELAQVSVQIGYLQWRRDNGFDNDRTPVLQVLDGFENKDALLNQTFRKKPKNLKEAQAGEHAEDDTVKVYTERAWPECDVIVSNPPFLGDKLMRGELGDDYVEELRNVFSNRIPGQSDFCCYWFEKARDLIEHNRCKRAGLLATQGIRGGANREVLKRIKETGDIFFAVSDRDWVLDGAMVHVSFVGFDRGDETERRLDGTSVSTIHSNLTSALDATKVGQLKANQCLTFQGPVRVGDFDIAFDEGCILLSEPNPNGKPCSDVLVPTWNGGDNTKRPRDRWVVDFFKRSVAEASLYEKPFRHVEEQVRPLREKGRREGRKLRWWQHGETGDAMRRAFNGHARFIAMAQTAKHLIFRWLPVVVHPEQTLIVFARSDDCFFGVLHSRIHRIWALSQGTQLREKESGFRYTPTTCFETFPFPFPDNLHPPSAPVESPKSKQPAPDRTYAEMLAAKNYYMGKEETPPYGVQGRSRREEALTEKSETRNPKSEIEMSLLTSAATRDEYRAAIAAAARELNELRERWLNPPEWTVEKILEFPGSVGGPWDRYIDKSTIHEVGRVTPCAPSGVDPDAFVGKRRRAEDCPPYLVGTVRYPRLERRDAECAAKLKKRTLTNLYNERPGWLDLAHKKLDVAVAAAYGWPADLTDEQVLERLLALNLERAAVEAKTAKAKKPKESRAKGEDEMI